MLQWNEIIQLIYGIVGMVIGLISYVFGRVIFKNRKKCKLFNYGKYKKKDKSSAA